MGPDDPDLLERHGLVKAITHLLERAPHDGFVVGLDGGWGEGKSSVMSLVARRLEQRARTQVIWFNPWLFASAEELVGRFFAELSSRVELQGYGAGSTAKALSRLGSALSRGRVVPGTVGDGMDIGGNLASGAGDLLADGKTLNEQRDQVNRGLRKLDRSVVVLIDDIDRLRSSCEIAELMRLVRSVGNLPRVTYLISYERNVVSAALGDGNSERGLKYLEKIVQATFELPPIRRDLLERLLVEAIDETLATVGDAEFDNRRFDLIRYHGFDRLFGNLRDVRRFTAAITAKVSQVHSEVDLADVLTLEALRLRDPRTFSKLMDDTTLLTSPGRRSLIGDTTIADRETRAAIYADAALPQQTERLIEQLFPATDQSAGSPTDDTQRRWRRQRRVAHPDILLIYLQNSVPAGVVSAEDVARARASFEDRARLAHLLQETESHRLGQLLTRLDDDEDPIAIADTGMAVQMLIAAAAEHRHPDPFQISDGTHLAITSLIVRLLKGRLPDEAERIVDGLTWPDLSVREDVLTDLGQREGHGRRVLERRTAERMEAELVNDILSAPAATLGKEHGLGRLMWIAYDIDPDRLRKRLPELIKDRLFLLRWLFSSTVMIRGEGTRYLLPWPRLINRVDSNVLTAAIDAMPDQWLDENASETEREVLEQARFYSRHPDEAEADFAPYDTD